MLKLIKMSVVLGLIVGVLLLAARIHQKSTEVEIELAARKDAVQKKILNIKREVANKTIDLGRVYERVRDEMDKATEAKSPVPERKKQQTAKTPEVGGSDAKKPVSTRAPIHPVDEEDRRLTQEILGKSPGDPFKSEKAMGISNIYDEAAHVQVPGKERESPSPMDLDRVAKIRDLYFKAVETLDFK